MIKWEYTSVRLSYSTWSGRPEPDTTLNSYGDSGWELINIMMTPASADPIAIFKRKKREQQEEEE